MSNKLAVYLFVLIMGAFLWDVIFNDLNTSLFLARKFSDLIEWLAFWR